MQFSEGTDGRTDGRKDKQADGLEKKKNIVLPLTNVTRGIKREKYSHTLCGKKHKKIRPTEVTRYKVFYGLH